MSEGSYVTVNRTGELKIGDAVRATVDGRTHDLLVMRKYMDQSIGWANSHTVTIGYGVGRWSFEVRNDTLRKYALARRA